MTAAIRAIKYTLTSIQGNKGQSWETHLEERFHEQDHFYEGQDNPKMSQLPL